MTKLKCWNCNAPREGQQLFCLSCNIIHPPGQINHFTRMNMPVDFDLGIKNLEVAYFSLQTKLHPDRFAQKSEKEKMLSMQQSMSVNEAYETLKNPLTRAEYMLQLQGVIVSGDNANVKPSQAILLESMATRERLVEATAAEEIRALTFETMEARLATIDSLKQNFIDGRLENAAQNAIKLRYLEKLNEEIKGKK